MKRKTLFRLICAVLCFFVLCTVSLLAVDGDEQTETTAPVETTVSDEEPVSDNSSNLYGAMYTFLTFFFPDTVVSQYAETFSKLAIVCTIVGVWWMLTMFLRAVGLIRRRKGM